MMGWIQDEPPLRVWGIEYYLVMLDVTTKTKLIELESLVLDHEFSEDLSQLDHLALFH